MSQENRKRSEKISGGAAVLDRHHEIYGIVFLLAAAIVFLALVSYSPTDPVFEGAGKKAGNLIGLVGAHLANGLLQALGASAFILVAALLYATAVAFTRGGIPLQLRKVSGYSMLVVLGTAFCHVAFRGHEFLGHAPGGFVGEVVGGLLLSLLSNAGSVILLVAGIVVGLIQVSPFSLVQVGRAAWKGLAWTGRIIGNLLARALKILGHWLLAALKAVGRALAREAQEFVESLRHPKRSEAARPEIEPALYEGPQITEEAAAAVTSGPEPEPGSQPAPEMTEKAEPQLGFLAPPVSMPPQLSRCEPAVVTGDPPPPIATLEPPKPAKRSFRDIQRLHEPEIVIPRPQDKAEREEPRNKEDPATPPAPDYKDYRLPSLDLLRLEEQKETVIEQDKLREYARKLEEKLADYGIEGQVTKIMPGPVVTMYEYAPGPGIKVSRIAGLSNDLALALEAMSVRIVAPIPGRAVVGIEVSNKERQTVYARDIVGHSTFQRSRSKLTLALGKDIEGAPYITDLNKMPHLLVAGATGTGKSVALNLMITSILYRNNPEDVRFILVDPKVLELSLYEGIPHLLLPVVTDPRKASAALYWAVNEMDRRIQVLHGAGVRDLDSYNRKVEKLRSGKNSKIGGTTEKIEEVKQAEPEKLSEPAVPAETDAPKPARRKVIVIDRTGESAAKPVEPSPMEPAAGTVSTETPAEPKPLDTEAPESAAQPPTEMAAEPAPAAGLEGTAEEPEELPSPAEIPLQKLPHIVIVIDELADLMMTIGREVETSIARIAQKARAAGIHLIVATQRPSVNVITGLIKANLPARISFRVASKIDSRTILDQNGAETLLGNGDMLFHPPTTSEILRIHGALITEEEITRVVQHLKSQAAPIYDESILASAEEPEEGEEADEGFSDELYDQAVAIVSEMGQASTSMVQRKLQIGYNRAARLIERMEKEGIVGPANGAKPREVLISSHLP